MILPMLQPFDLETSIECGQVFQWRRHGPWFCGVISGQIIHLREVAEGLEIDGGPAAAVALCDITAKFLRVDDPFTEIYKSISVDPYMLCRFEYPSD